MDIIRLFVVKIFRTRATLQLMIAYSQSDSKLALEVIINGEPSMCS